MEEVDGQHAGGLLAQKLPPAGIGVTQRRRWDSMVLQGSAGSSMRKAVAGLSSSPWILRYPQLGFSRAMRSTSAAMTSSIGGRRPADSLRTSPDCCGKLDSAERQVAR
jgi:hypothetical protein